MIPMAEEFFHLRLLEEMRLSHLLTPVRCKRLHCFPRGVVGVLVLHKRLVVDGPGECPNVLFVATLID